VNSHETVVYENSFPLEGRTFKNAGYISRQVKTLLQRMKLSKEVVRRAAIVTYEAEINIYSYAERGKIILQVTPKQIIIEAIDEGQGIENIKLAIHEGRLFNSYRKDSAHGLWGRHGAIQYKTLF